MNLYLYRDLDTPVHRLDPRVKLAWLVGSFVLALLFQHPLYVAGVAALVLCHGALGRVLGNLKRVWVLLAAVGLLSVVLWAVMAKGQTPWFWRVSRESFLYGLGTGLKLCTMMAAGVVFLSTTRHEALAQGLIRLGLPYSVAFTLTTALRLVPAFLGTGAAVVQAQRSRGLDLETRNPLRRARNAVPLLTPIFLLTLRSTHQLAMALESRAFGDHGRRSFYRTLHWSGRDTAALTLLLLGLLLGLALRWAGFGRIPGLEG